MEKAVQELKYRNGGILTGSVVWDYPTSFLHVPHDDVAAAVRRDQLVTQREKETHFLFVFPVLHHYLANITKTKQIG